MSLAKPTAHSELARSPKVAPQPSTAAGKVSLSPDEGPGDSALVTAQTLWGLGNLSPFDHLVGSTAIVNLVPAANLAFVGHHLGNRIRRYAEDTGMWIDAFEVESVLSQRHTKKNSTIKLFDWKKDAGRLRKNRYAALIAAQASMTSPSLDTLYGQCASALKANGKFFAADLMWASPDGRPASQPQDGKAPAWHSLRSVDEHKAAIAASGLSIETSYDLTDGLLAAIRSGLAGSIDSLSELRSLGEPRKSQRRSAFSAELETWGSYYFLGQKRAIRAMGLLAVKRNAAAVRK